MHLLLKPDAQTPCSQMPLVLSYRGKCCISRYAQQDQPKSVMPAGLEKSSSRQGELNPVVLTGYWQPF